MIREALPADAEAMARIYNHYVVATLNNFEEQALSVETMANRIAENHYLVHEVDGQVLAFAGASPWKPRSAYRFTRETSVYVDEAHQGKGLAEPLFRELIRQMKHRGYRSLVATIAGHNERSIRFHEKLGFVEKGQLDTVGFKLGQWVDVGFWQLTLDPPEFVPFLRTQRLDLIRMCDEGAEELHIIRSHPQVSLFTRRPLDRGLEETKQFISRIEDGIRGREWLYWLIRETDSARIVGTLCLWHFNDQRTEAEVGYELHPDFWGRGYTTEALQRLVRYAFEETGIQRMTAYTHPMHHASVRVLEKAGFSFVEIAEESIDQDVREEYAVYHILKPGGNR